MSMKISEKELKHLTVFTIGFEPEMCRGGFRRVKRNLQHFPSKFLQADFSYLVSQR